MSNEWFTPHKIVDAVRKVLGIIDLDPASAKKANTVIQAATYYDKVRDGLQQHWRGKTYLNPPYSKPLPWIKKLTEHYSSGDIPCALALVKVDLSTKSSRLLLGKSNGICFFLHRVDFLDPKNMERREGSSDFSNCIFSLGNDYDVFYRAFSEFGIVFRLDSIALNGLGQYVPKPRRPKKKQ